MSQARPIVEKAAFLVIICVALYDLWVSLEAIRMIMARGSSLSHALFSPPTSFMRVLSCTLITLGAALAMSSKRFGFPAILIGVGLYAVLVFALATQSFGIDIWIFEGIRLSIIVTALAFIAVFRAIRRKSSSHPH